MSKGSWVLGLAVAAVIPIAVGGAACSASNEPHEPSAGAAGSSSAGGSAAKDGSGGASAGGAATSAGESTGASANGGDSSGGTASTCCNPGDPSSCAADGQRLKSCSLRMGSACGSSATVYSHVWLVQTCPSGCIADALPGGGADGASPRCR